MADDNLRSPQSPFAPARAEAEAPARTAQANHQPAAVPGGFLATVKDALWSKAPAPPPRQHESLREIVETVVFVVVLVLLLKSFIAEAFVIPTGSMADTLWGYQKVVKCPECGHEFPVNCSQEVDPQDGAPMRVTACTCENCRLPIRLINPSPQADNRMPNPEVKNEVLDPGANSGDRVLVDKYAYDLLPGKPSRFDVVVFKYPGDSSSEHMTSKPFPHSGPQQNWVQMNYIKRLVALGNETLGIWYGDLYVMEGGLSAPLADEVPLRDRWKKDHMHEDEPEAIELLKKGQRFKILQKSPDKVLAMKRLVYDNDQPAKDLQGPRWQRWASADEGAWAKAPDSPHGFRHTPGEGDRYRWLRYRHLLRDGGDKPQLITDFLGYNTYWPRKNSSLADPNWVGDLILECEATVDDAKGELVLELSRGVERFRASWDLATGQWKLFRLRWPHKESKAPGDEAFKELARSDKVTLKGKGTYQLRFANVDQRLTVWVNGKLPFDEGVSYADDPPKEQGPYANDLQPASIGAKGGAVTVNHLKLWRDTYYTTQPGHGDGAPEGGDWADPKQWEPLRKLRAKTLYVQPGHYLCLGDNSTESSDSRHWGTVPERLLLGRALVVYYPFYFPYWPLKSPVNRVGAIE